MKSFSSRENDINCKADGIEPYFGVFKRFYCSEEKLGKKCENDKFCDKKKNERCICASRCEERHCKAVGKDVIDVVLVSLLFSLNGFHLIFWCSYC